jgi:hypothetical protein
MPLAPVVAISVFVSIFGKKPGQQRTQISIIINNEDIISHKKYYTLKLMIFGSIYTSPVSLKSCQFFIKQMRTIEINSLAVKLCNFKGENTMKTIYLVAPHSHICQIKLQVI